MDQLASLGPACGDSWIFESFLKSDLVKEYTSLMLSQEEYSMATKTVTLSLGDSKI